MAADGGLEHTEESGLILWLAGEKVVRNFRFLATFRDTIEWTVKDGTREIGTIASPVPPGERFALPGRTWEVVDLVTEDRLIVVRRVGGRLRVYFGGGGGGEIHDRVVDRMRQVLTESADYSYLTDRARRRIEEARQLAGATGIAARPAVIPLGGDQLALLPWCGTRKVDTMRLAAGTRCTVRPGGPLERFFVTVSAKSGEAEGLVASLRTLAAEPWDGATLVAGLARGAL